MLPSLSGKAKRQLDRILRAPRDRPERTTLEAFARAYLAHHFPLPPSAFHAWTVAELETLHQRRGTRLDVIAPRGSAKTTWVSQAYPLYCAVHALERFILLLSDTTGQAQQNLATIKDELEGNEELARDFPQAAGPGPVWRQDRIELRNGVVIEAHGSGSKIRGKKSREGRPSLVITDDPENEDHATSAVLRDRSWRWYCRTVLNVGTPETNYLTLGTSLHRECLVLRLQRQPGWKGRLFKAVVEWPQRMDLWARWEELLHDWENDNHEAAALAFYQENKADMDRGAVVLWPEREPLYALMQLRATIGAAAFAAEKQGDPVDPSLCEWPAEYFDWPGFWFDTWPSQLEVKVLSLDPSKGKDAKTSDYSPFVKIGRDRSGVNYIECDCRNDRDVTVISHTAAAHVKDFRPDAFAVEYNGFQELLALPLQLAAEAARVDLPIRPVDNTVNKLVRIRRLTPFLAQRRLRFKARSPGTLLLVQQMKDFPVGDYDDAPDALEQGLRTVADILADRRQQAPARLRT